ncbi:MAG TPA: glycosyltransferase family 2 protein [Myxococcota bacterium]|nr:glycosyltransferase family 2 protein [Myxococcota bacterium]HRY94074.1 glycosyltransferase family 2 protein [Myxococcota bacterium]HSA23146.1 glycosyltransferase family 2 protein [Myxococcota bacterium]
MGREGAQLSIVVPVYNEASGLARSVDELEGWSADLGVSWELLLVDDGSQDSSLELMRSLSRTRPWLRPLRLGCHLGRGRALREGMRQATGRVLLTTEADGSWDPRGLRSLVRSALADEADVVLASPHRRGAGLVGVPLGRRLLSRGASLATRLLLGHGLTMATGMTRAYRAEVVPRILSDLPGKEFHADVLCRALQSGLRILELPVQLSWRPERRARRSSGGLLEWVPSACQHLALLATCGWALRRDARRAGAP